MPLHRLTNLFISNDNPVLIKFIHGSPADRQPLRNERYHRQPHSSQTNP
jgi:hypothetical protein